ncbi:hypothetical protein PHISCL_10761, partial [Aspergillus sclerotialis]
MGVMDFGKQSKRIDQVARMDNQAAGASNVPSIGRVIPCRGPHFGFELHMLPEVMFLNDVLEVLQNLRLVDIVVGPGI